MFRITYSDDKDVWRRTGAWEDLPLEDVQLVEYVQADGDSVVLSGFDSYYLAGDVLWGGSYDEKGIWPWDGVQYEILPGRPARQIAFPGAIPAGADVKLGRLISDGLAQRLGLATDWRPLYEARKAEVTLGR